MTRQRIGMRGVGVSGVGVRAWARRVVADRPVWLSVFVATTLAIALSALAPRVLEHASAADLRESLVEATPQQRNLVVETDTRIGASGRSEPFKWVERRGELLLEDMPDDVRATIIEQRFVYASPRFDVSSWPDGVGGPFPTTFRFRHQNGLEAHQTLVAGSEPQPADPELVLEGPECPDALDPFVVDPDDLPEGCGISEIPVFEVLLTQQTADDMSVGIGDSVQLAPRLQDLAWLTAARDISSLRLVIRVVGIVELTDPSDPFWFADDALHRPRITENPDFRLVFAAGSFRLDQYRALLNVIIGVNSHYSFRYVVDPDVVATADASDLAREFDKVSPPGHQVVTRLPHLLRSHDEQRSLALRLLSIAVVGIAAVATASVMLLARLSAIRGRGQTTLLADRGASRLQLATAALATGVLVCVPAAAVASVVAWAGLSSTSSTTPLRVAAVLCLVVMVTVVASGMAQLSSGRPRGLVLDVVMAVVAIGGVISLRRRGAIEGVSTDVDWLLAGLPAVIAVTASALLVRLVKPTVTRAAAVAKRRRGLGLFVGLRRVGHRADAIFAPGLAVVLSVSVAVLALVLARSLDERQDLASWMSVGADHRLEAVHADLPLPADVASSFLDEAGDVSGSLVVRGRVVPAIRLTAQRGTATANLVALDSRTYASVVDRSAISIDGSEVIPALAEAGSSGDASRAIAVGIRSLTVGPGDMFEATIGGTVMTIEIIATTDGFPGVPAGAGAVVVDFDQFRSAVGERFDQPSFLLIEGSRSDGTRLQEIAEADALVVGHRSRFDRLDQIAGDPLSQWIDRSLLAVVVASVAFAVVSIVAAVAIATPARRRDLGLLRLLGGERGDHRTITMLDHVPVVAAAAVMGALVGAVSAALLEPALDLELFADGAVVAGVAIPLAPIVGLVLVAVASSAVVAEMAARGHGRGTSTILRAGENHDD